MSAHQSTQTENGQVELVGRKIRRLRKERKLTQSELAGRIGIQQSDLSRIERGEYRVSLDTLFRMLAEFKVSVGEFFDERRTESMGPREVLMVQQFNALPNPDQQEIRSLIAQRAEQDRRTSSGQGGRAGEGSRTDEV